MYFCFGFVLTCLLALANGSKLINNHKCGFTLTATCDDHMELYADGKILANTTNWRTSVNVKIPANTKEIKIHCTDGWIVGGILASSDKGLRTNDKMWECSSDNGTTWLPAYNMGENGKAVPDIAKDAQWIWTGKKHWKHNKDAVCRINLGNTTCSNKGVCEYSACDTPQGCQIKKGTNLTTLTKLGKEFSVSVEVNPKSYANGLQNIIHFTTGRGCCSIGMRVPALFIDQYGQLNPVFAINGEDRYGETLPDKHALNKWIKVEFSQTLEGCTYIYRVKVDGCTRYVIENKDPRVFTDVKVYGSGSWDNALNGKIRNLFVNTKSSKSCEELKFNHDTDLHLHHVISSSLNSSSLADFQSAYAACGFMLWIECGMQLATGVLACGGSKNPIICIQQLSSIQRKCWPCIQKAIGFDASVSNAIMSSGSATYGICYPDVTVENKLPWKIAGYVSIAACSNGNFANLQPGKTYRHDRGCFCLVTSVHATYVDKNGSQVSCSAYTSSGTSYSHYNAMQPDPINNPGKCKICRNSDC